jgi:hypothetical protein
MPGIMELVAESGEFGSAGSGTDRDVMSLESSETFPPTPSPLLSRVRPSKIQGSD